MDVSNENITNERSIGHAFEQTEFRHARVQHANSSPVGICLVLTDDELRELGVDVSDADSVAYRVVDGHLRLTGRNLEVSG